MVGCLLMNVRPAVAGSTLKPERWWGSSHCGRRPALVHGVQNLLALGISQEAGVTGLLHAVVQRGDGLAALADLENFDTAGAAADICDQFAHCCNLPILK